MELFMRLSIGFLAFLCVGAVSQAMATDPPATSAPTTAAPAPATETAATTETQTSTKTAATTQSATASEQAAPKTVKLVAGDADADAKLRQLKGMGYKAEMHGSEVVFCRRETVLGSRFEKKVCNTAEALEQQMLDSQDATKQAQRNLTAVPHGN
jgi:hypothetical protein